MMIMMIQRMILEIYMNNSCPLSHLSSHGLALDVVFFVTTIFNNMVCPSS